MFPVDVVGLLILSIKSFTSFVKKSLDPVKDVGSCSIVLRVISVLLELLLSCESSSFLSFCLTLNDFQKKLSGNLLTSVSW